MGNFTFIETKIRGVYIVETAVFGDERGYFMETYEQADFRAAGLDYTFVQDNQSASRRGVLRGEVFDVAVDLRAGSETYGEWVCVVLSGENKRQFMIPRGFAHGFLVLSDTAEFAYKCDEFYHPEDEGGIAWNDPDVAIDWPAAGEVILSEKDRRHPTLAESRITF